MSNTLEKKFYYTINNLKKIHTHDGILIALSGGQDSLCLIKLMQTFKRNYNKILKINYIYIDHQWKKDSKKQIKHIINLIEDTSILYIYQIKKITISEQQARNLRYKTIIQHALKYKYANILTAHTETDKIETFWQQIIRGTSIDGATSLVKSRILNNKIYLYRPLLDFTRKEINWICRKFCLPIWSDITNYNLFIQRNRLRHEFIPYLNKYFSNNIEKKINSFLQISILDNEYIKQNAIKLYLLSRHRYNIAINYQLLKKQHIALQTRTLQIFFYHNCKQCLNQENLQSLTINISNINSNLKIIQYNNLIIKIEKNWLYI